MGVRSTRVESFFDFFTPCCFRLDISAMVEWFWNEMRDDVYSINPKERSLKLLALIVSFDSIKDQIC
jgi:hypothetical protein